MVTLGVFMLALGSVVNAQELLQLFFLLRHTSATLRGMLVVFVGVLLFVILSFVFFLQQTRYFLPPLVSLQDQSAWSQPGVVSGPVRAGLDQGSNPDDHEQDPGPVSI